MTQVAYASNAPLNVTTAVGIPASLVTATTYTSPIVPLLYAGSIIPAQTAYGPIVVALTSTQIVTITIRRFLDSAGLIPLETATSFATTANTAAYVSVNSVLPALYFQVTVNNTSGSTATITNIGVAIAAITS